MKTTKNGKMAMSQRPDGRIYITGTQLQRLGVELDPMDWAACSDAMVTEIVAMTEDAFADFVGRYGGKPIYPTLAAWPAPRG